MKHAIYLYFNGNCEEAINFYKDTLHGTIESTQRFGDAPGMEVSESHKNKILHSVLDLLGMHVMCSDCSEKNKVTFGDNFAIALDFTSDDTIREAFNGLSAGGKITMPLQDMFWGATFGMCTDKFGINWMFNFDKPKG